VGTGEFEGYNEIAYWAKGHLDKSEFRHEVECEFGYYYPLAKIWHSYARNVPVGQDRPGEQITYLDVEPGRGAYPITLIDLII
jgi:hypothetical protein